MSSSTPTTDSVKDHIDLDCFDLLVKKFDNGKPYGSAIETTKAHVHKRLKSIEYSLESMELWLGRTSDPENFLIELNEGTSKPAPLGLRLVVKAINGLVELGDELQELHLWRDGPGEVECMNRIRPEIQATRKELDICKQLFDELIQQVTLLTENGIDVNVQFIASLMDSKLKILPSSLT